jgi:NADPH:quinone reductase-like Zn-dependent oxidoreductase
MKAISLQDFGEIENLVAVDLPIPTAQTGQVLVKAKSTSINPIDVKTRSGKGIAGVIKDKLPVVLGWDISGIVQEVGPDVSDFQVGDEVFGMLAFPGLGSTYAEYTVANASELGHKPHNISHDEAAAAPLAALTAWQALTLHGSIKSGDRVLIHAAAGGVGHYAVQQAKHLGAYVIGTASAGNHKLVLDLGADECIDYRNTPFESAVSDIDFVLDTIGGDYIDRSLLVTKKGGTIVSIPSGLNETVAEKAELKGVNGYRMRVIPKGSDMEILADLMEKGIVRSHVSKTFPLEELGEAHRHLEGGHTVGKVTVRLS